MKTVLKLVLVACIIAIGSPAFASDIVNGGFEDGTFNGWTTAVTTAITSGAGTDPRTNNAVSLVGIGTHSAKVGDEIAYGSAGGGGIAFKESSITQTFTKSTTFSDLYFAWAAVGLAPSNTGHTDAQTPWFQIKIEDLSTTSTLYSKEEFTGNVGAINAGWVKGIAGDSTNTEGTWYYYPWTEFHLNLGAIANGDNIQVTLTTKDCDLSGHPMYAYLDGFGSVPTGVPEPATMLLLGFGLVGVAGLRRRFTK